jgi:DNA-binding NarL/FixJ family response regulator
MTIRVIIVDDEPLAREGIRIRLKQQASIKCSPDSGVSITVTLPIDNKTIGLAHDY